MYHLNGLLICRGKTLEYTPDEEVRTGAVVLENVLTDDRKAMAGMGTKVLIWPDKVAFDTGTGELTRLGAQWEMGGKSVTVTPCDAEGRTYTPAGAGKTEPKEPEDGQLFLKSDSNEAYDSNAVLLRYSAKNKKWGGSAAERGEDPVSGDRRSDPGGGHCDHKRDAGHSVQCSGKRTER